jgi:Oxidoreductase family, NAD-binding Rossmann fold
VTLVAGADIDPERLADFGADWNIASDHLYADYRELLDRERPDLVSICAYATERVEMARAAIEAGARGLWLEKAVACSMAEASALRELADRAGVAIVVNHMRRADPAWRRVAEIVASGELGRLESVHAIFSGHFLHTGTHAWDALDEWCGPWASVQCWAEGQEGRSAQGHEEAQARRSAEAPQNELRMAWPFATRNDGVDADSGWAATPRTQPGASVAEPGARSPESDRPGLQPEARSLQPESDASGLAHIVFENGVHAFVSGSKKRYFKFECDLTFTAGRIQIGNDVQRIWRPAPSPRYEGFVELAESAESLDGGALLGAGGTHDAAAPSSLLDALLNGIETCRDRLGSLDAAIRAMNLGLAVVCASARPDSIVTPADLAIEFRVDSV